MTIFFRLLDCQDKAAALLEQIRSPDDARGRRRFDVDPADFARVPRSPFAYWVSERMRRLFSELPPFESDGRAAKLGLKTDDDFRFVRLWVESSDCGPTWVPLLRGGVSSPFYSDVICLLNWRDSGSEMKSLATARWGNVGKRIFNETFYFRSGLTWPLRGIRFSSQAAPAGCIFSVAGKMAFVPDDTPMSWLAIFNSEPFDRFIAFFAGKVGGVQYEAGLIQRVPVPRLAPAEQATLALLARRAWSLKRSMDTSNETSHAFCLPALMQTNGATLAERCAAWMNRIKASEAELAAIQAEIDGRCFDLYGIDQADRHGITEGIGAAVDTTIDGAEPKLHGEGLDDREQEDDDTEPEEATADAISLDTDLLSWAAGVAFGRFDVRIATGERVPPAEPDPFDTLPVCSPGMLTGDDGLPLRQTPADYPLVLPDDGLMADDPGHPRDLTTAVRAVFELVFDADADARWHEAAAMLDPQDRDLRRWFGKVFFEKHLKRYSKSRRKAPILWQLATPSASYSVWLYIHRLTKDSFYQLQNDLVAPKRAHEERKLASLTQAAGDSPTASQRKEIAAQEAFVDELRTLRDEVARIAPLWDPDLNDGVVITAAPLWRLVPQHKSWQKELQIVWDALCAGKYDWSYLSMHLWPERVVPKCADDRSLAIAHDLEDMLWVKDNGRWRKLTEPKQEIAEHKTGRDKEAYRRLRDGLETLADRADATLAAAELWRQLEADKLDESLAALCLWPRRVLELCTADPDLARRLEVKLPAKRTKAALDKLVKQYETAGYGDLLDVVRAALAECNEPFRDLWQQLADGRLDDLPLALALWPDRVVDRCTEDRELADRHDLARYFWYHEPTGDWRRRKSPDQEVADEVARRHNPTVKAALQSLLDAGSPTGGKGGRKRKR